MFESALLAISYPLRLMATFLSVGILKLFGVAVTADRTLITIGSDGHGLAVTDACGGIEQLWALILVSVVFAVLMQKGFSRRVLQACSFLPALVLANAIRLVLTVVLYNAYGAVILADTCHHGLGYVQCVLAIVFIWLFGKVLRLTA